MPSSPIAFESPVVSSYSDTSDGSLLLTDRSETPRYLIKAAADSAAANGLGVSFGHSRAEGSALICGSRPNEWTIMGEAAACAAVIDGLDTSGHVTVLEYTHSRALFQLTGENASKALEKICSLDFGDHMTPNGAVVSASVGKTGCDLVRHDSKGTPSYLIACDRSFGQYMFDVLLDSGKEFGVGVN